MPLSDPDLRRRPDGGPDSSHHLGEMGGFDADGGDLLPLPEGALDDLPPPPSGVSSWLGREDLARDESDVIRGLSQQPPPPGSSNIFDTGPGGSSRFRVADQGTEHLTGEQPRPSNDVLYADLAATPGPSGLGGDLFGRGDSDPARPSGRPGSSGGPDFDATSSGDEGSNLFADPTAADLDLDDESAVPLGGDPSSGDLRGGGTGSSIFAGGLGPQGSGMGVDHIPIMASGEEALAEPLEFDSDPPRPPAPSGIVTADDAVGFDLPGPPSGELHWDRVATADGAGSSQKSRRMSAAEAAELDHPAALDALAGPAPRAATVRRKAAEVTGRAPVPEPAGRRGGPLLFGAGGLLAGAGATLAATYFLGFLGADQPPPRPVASAPSAPAADPDAVTALTQKLEADAAAERKRLEGQLAAADRKAAALRAELDTARLPDPELRAVQLKLLDAQSAAGEARKDAAEATGRLKGMTAALTAAEARAAEVPAAADRLAAAEARAKRADEALAGVVQVVRANGLAADGDDPLAGLAARLKSMTDSADSKTAAAAVAAARNEAEAARADLLAARQSAQAAAAEGKKARDELAAATAAADERVKAARADADAREAAARKDAEQARARLEDEHRRQLADARGGVAVPLGTAEQRARDVADYGLGLGMSLFTVGDFVGAQKALEGAVERYDGDARSWYYLGLSRWHLGDGAGADAAFRKGAEAERKGRVGKKAVGFALERVQGPDRQVLARYRP